MDRESTELSKAGLRLFSKEMSAEYRRIQELLVGRLAAHGATGELLAQQEVNDRQNIKMLTAFVKSLPAANFDPKAGWIYKTNDAYRMRVFQTNVLWHEELAGTEKSWTKSARPYYILGKSGAGKDAKWLMGSAGTNDTRKTRQTHDNYSGIYIFSPHRKNRDAVERQRILQGSDFPSPDQAREMFNLDSHLFEVSAQSPGAILAKGEGIFSRYHIPDFQPKPMTRISDAQLGAFDVSSHLHRIATSLNMEESLHRILSEYSLDKVSRIASKPKQDG